MEITKEKDGLNTKLFTKMTDRNNTLERSSFHAPQTFRGIPKSQFVRARRVCKKNEEYQENMRKIIDTFTAIRYNRKQVENIGKQVGETSRGKI